MVECADFRSPVDVVVVGGGNAGFSAAHAAREAGANVLVLEKASPDVAGGNSFYTAGAFRTVIDSLASVRPLLADDPRLSATVLPSYSRAQFAADMERVTGGRCDDELAGILTSQSAPTLRWLHDKGLRFRLMYERQAYEEDGKWVFWGGLAVGTVDGGRGLVERHTAIADRDGVRVAYDSAVSALDVADTGRVEGVVVEHGCGSTHRVAARAVVLAAGGFQANAALRERHLGPGWSRAVVRGTPTNTGEVLELALAAGAARSGDWGGCHSVAVDAKASPNGGDRRLTNQLTRQSYPLGVVVNRDGRRFLDEGADFRNLTYAKYGREILAQPEGIAVQIYDAKTFPLLRSEEYGSTPITMGEAATVEELARLVGVDAAGLVETVGEFNAAVEDRPFNPTVKDGLAAVLPVPKSNWAQRIDTPPYYGYPVTCGITFTFGGLRINGSAQVVDDDGEPLPGLYAAGELVGGLFHGNYPGGSGLTAGAVFGRIAGRHAAGSGRPDPL